MKKLFCILLCALLLWTPLRARTEEEPVIQLNGSKSDPAHLSDGDIMTYVRLAPGDTLTVRTSEGARHIYISWYRRPKSVTAIYLDADGAELEREEISPDACFTLTGRDDCYEIVLYSTRDELLISEVKPVGADFEPPFTLSNEPCDILVILPQYGDECRRLGAMLAQYSAENDMSIQLCYVTQDTRERMHETLLSLNKLEIGRYPRFAELVYRGYEREYHLENNWGRELRGFIETSLENTRPRIVIGIAPDAVNANPLHGDNLEITNYVAATLESLIPASPNAPDKFYMLSTEGTVLTIGEDSFNLLLEACVLQYSQRVFRITPQRELSFRLLFSNVGEDNAGGTLLDNLSIASFISYSSPTPTPTATPTPTPTPTPTATPTATAAPTEKPTSATTLTPMPQEDEGDKAPSYAQWLLPCLIVAGLALLVLIVINVQKRGRRRTEGGKKR